MEIKEENWKMIKGEVLFKKEGYKFVWLGWDEKSNIEIVQTNQYLIISNDEGILLDPGGVHLFSKVVATASKFIDFSNITKIFFTHQDPDVSSGIAMWLGITKATVYISGLWVRFMPHFGIFDQERITGIPDKGTKLNFKDGNQLYVLPAHFLHSTGNFIIYDPISKILFSGDIGAAVFPENVRYLFVDNFDNHLQYIEGFHRRYMTSNKACKKLVDMISKYDIEMIAPQHGAIFRGESVRKFLDFLYNLKCGVDIIDKFYS